MGCRPRPSSCLTPVDLAGSTNQQAREALRFGLGIEELVAGAPHRVTPLFTGVPGREVPELRIDGMPVGPVRWPETAPSPVPFVAIERACLRRYSPLNGPLSSTGGPVIDATLRQPRPEATLSTIRLTQGSYGTFAEEIELRRAVGPALVSAFYGDSKSDGRGRWYRQEGQTVGARAGHSLAGGWCRWGLDEAFDRSRQLTTKRGLWDRTAYSFSWDRPDSTGLSIRAGVQGSRVRGAWETNEGRTERRGRSLDLFGYAAQEAEVGLLAGILEIELTRSRFRSPGKEQLLLEDASIGVAVGLERVAPSVQQRVSCGLVRLAPLKAAPVFAAEVEIHHPGLPTVLVHGSRAVRNRTLPRLPGDGEAWIRQGIDLAAERDCEQGEALWRFGIEGGTGGAGAVEASLGFDLLHGTRGLAPDAAGLEFLGSDAQDDLPEKYQREGSTFLTPWLRCRAGLPWGLRMQASCRATAAEGDVLSHLGLAAIRGEGELGWGRLLFHGDLLLDLALRAEGRTRAATPYGVLPAVGMLDGEARGRIGSADLFVILANVANANELSFTYDGGFFTLPRRHYRAGIRWTFTD